MSENREYIIDNFAGGGGASTGIELALGQPIDIAVNHDGDAIAMHTVIVFVPSKEEDSDRITCGNALISGYVKGK